MDIGSLDVRRKPCPEGFYRGVIMDVGWKEGLRDGETVNKAKIRIQIKTDNPNSDESTIGKNVFDNIPWTEDMAWKAGSIYAAANGLSEDDEDLEEMTKEKFETIKTQEVQFDVKHNIIMDDSGKKRTMVNVQNYKAVQG